MSEEYRNKEGQLICSMPREPNQSIKGIALTNIGGGSLVSVGTLRSKDSILAYSNNSYDPYHRSDNLNTQLLMDQYNKILNSMLGIACIPTNLPGVTMNKDLHILVSESLTFIDSAKDLDEAKSKARSYSNKNKCQVFIVKAIWSCAPKTDLVENEY